MRATRIKSGRNVSLLKILLYRMRRHPLGENIWMYKGDRLDMIGDMREKGYHEECLLSTTRNTPFGHVLALELPQLSVKIFRLLGTVTDLMSHSRFHFTRV